MITGWKPYVASWIDKRQEKDQAEILHRLFGKYVQVLLDFKREKCTEMFPVTDLNGVISLCNLFEALATPENGVVPQDSDFYERMVSSRYYVYDNTSIYS